MLICASMFSLNCKETLDLIPYYLPKKVIFHFSDFYVYGLFYILCKLSITCFASEVS